MSVTPIPRLISCDESGFTGNHMLNAQQPYFAYASHDLTLEDSADLVAQARAALPVQMTELKAGKLLGSARGRKLLAFVLDRMEGRYIATLHEKRLSLCCKLFEYIYEPVLQENNALFYRNNLHRFVAMYLYVQLKASGASIDALAAEFEAFMRSLDPADAPNLLGTARGAEPDPLIGQILRFARGYRSRIIEEARSLQDAGAVGKWALDLTTTAVFGQLGVWGERHPVLDVVCDDSKPLQATREIFDVMVGRTDNPAVHLFGKRRPLTWNMSRPLQFASSATHPGIQLADLVAGVAAAIPTVGTRPELRELAERVIPHLGEDCIMPDMDIVDFKNEDACVNWVILEGLAARADEGADPLYLMDQIYTQARRAAPMIRARLRAA